MEDYSVLDSDFKKLIDANLEGNYCAMVMIHYDKKDTNPESGFPNKRKL